jgi:hypothetical protein
MMRHKIHLDPSKVVLAVLHGQCAYQHPMDSQSQVVDVRSPDRKHEGPFRMACYPKGTFFSPKNNMPMIATTFR